MRYELISQRTEASAIEQILVNRGILSEDIEHYLNTRNCDILDPSSIENIGEGAKLLISHISRNNKIHIQVDSDADGYTSAALLINYLNTLFPAFTKNNISYSLHKGKQHGIDLQALDLSKISLVIAPDASSNEYEIHQCLKEQGIDILVIDHHEAERYSENACVINNQLCDYPTKSLSGVGMVYKFCCYLDELLGRRHAEKFLDLVAVGLVSDMMDLRDFETKHLISLGLKNIKNPFLRRMVAKQEFSLGKELTPIGVAFYIAPFINAVTRSGTVEEKTLLFESMLDFKGFEEIPSTKRGDFGSTETRAEQACRNCVNIKNRQGNARDSGLETIENLIEENNLLDNKILVVTLDENNAIERSLAGLIANQLMAKYQKPTLILSLTKHDEEIWWEGSGRNSERSSLEDLRGYLDSTGLVEYAEGHSSAFGIGIKDENLNAFIRKINRDLKDYDFTPKYYVDFIYDGKSVDELEILSIGEYKSLWGQCVSEPLVVIENLPISGKGVQLLKRNTLKISLPLKNGLSLIKFGSSEEEYNDLYSELGCVTINVLGRCEKNSYDDKPQIKIVDYEIIRRTAYYF